MNKDSVMKATKYCLKSGGWLREYKRVDELFQGTLCTSMELSQLTPLVILMYANLKNRTVDVFGAHLLQEYGLTVRLTRARLVPASGGPGFSYWVVTHSFVFQ
jgi:hypothetical protein